MITETQSLKDMDVAFKLKSMWGDHKIYKYDTNKHPFIEYIISEESKGLRLDLAISNEYDQYSRSLIQ